MDWHAASRSQSRARGSGVGMGMGIGMDWRPGSRSHTRSCPSQLHLQTTADMDSSLMIPPIAMTAPTPLPTSKVGSLYCRVSARTARERAEPVDEELANFQRDPACSWVHAAPQQQQHVRQIGEIVQPQHVVSSNEEQQQTEQQEAQDEDFGGFMSASLPAFHLGFSFVQPFAATGTGTASPFSKHVRSISLDHTLSGDGSAASQLLAGHQKLLLPKVPESTLVCGSINVQAESEAYTLTTRANTGLKSHSLIPSWT